MPLVRHAKLRWRTKRESRMASAVMVALWVFLVAVFGRWLWMAILGI